MKKTMYQVLSVYRWEMSNRVDVISYHLSDDIKEAKRVFKEVSKREGDDPQEKSTVQYGENETIIHYENKAWKSIGLNEIETSDGELTVELN